MRAASTPTRARDCGVDGWFRAVELRPEDLDEIKVGGSIYVDSQRYHVSGISKKYRPVNPDGAVVLLAFAHKVEKVKKLPKPRKPRKRDRRKKR